MSPFGQKKTLPTVVVQSALGEPYVCVHAGRCGLQLRLAPADLLVAAGAPSVTLVA